jgi:hypothetical protein
MSERVSESGATKPLHVYRTPKAPGNILESDPAETPLTLVEPDTPARAGSLVDVQLAFEHTIPALVGLLPLWPVRRVVVHRPELAVPNGSLRRQRGCTSAAIHGPLPISTTPRNSPAFLWSVETRGMQSCIFPLLRISTLTLICFMYSTFRSKLLSW